MAERNRIKNIFLSFNNGREDIIVFHVKVFLTAYCAADDDVMYYMTSVAADESLYGVINFAAFNNKNGIGIDYKDFTYEWGYIRRGELITDINNTLGNLPNRYDKAEERLNGIHLPYIMDKIRKFADKYNLIITEE